MAEKELAEREWSRVCHDYYHLVDEVDDEDFHQRKRLLEKVLYWYEELKLSVSAHDKDTTIRIPIDKKQETCEHTKVLMSILQNYYNENPSERLAKMEQIKQTARAGFHKQHQQTMVHRLERLLDTHQSTHYQPHISMYGLIPKLSEREPTVLRMQIRELDDFVQLHQKNIGTHPFLHGLLHCLQQTTTSDCVVGWQFEDAVLIEGGGSEFLESAVILLTRTLHFAHVTDGDLRTWFTDPFVSDAQLRRLLRKFPPLSSLAARPTGSVVYNREITRHNRDGQDDPACFSWWSTCVVL